MKRRNEPKKEKGKDQLQIYPRVKTQMNYAIRDSHCNRSVLKSRPAAQQSAAEESPSSMPAQLQQQRSEGQYHSA